MKMELTKEKGRNSLLFIKEVAKYFMDFLETDFHKRKNPKRSIKLRNNDNLLIGLNLNKYPTFNKQVWKLINHGFDKSTFNLLEKGVYKTNLPKNLLDLIRLQVKKISTTQVNKLITDSANEIEKAAALYNKEYDKALTTSLEGVSKLIRSGLVDPFIENIEKPLQNLNLGDEDNIYLIAEELTAVLSRLLENKVSEILNLLIAKNKISVAKELKVVFEIDDAKNNILGFFENVQVADLFSEVFEIERNKSILDKQEFYLYFGDISFNNARYPIFYIPFNVIKQNDALIIDFDAQIYINKRALEYIVQEYNNEKGTKGNLKTISERIIYLAQHQDNLIEVLNGILNEIINFFQLDGGLDFSKPNLQSAKSPLVRASNACYINLFDKSDEALVNDYEEILQLLTSGDGVLGEAFNELIDDFIHKNPQPFNPEVENEWDNTPTTDKLVHPSPIPLNSEQLQILSAIKKDGCKYVIVAGPPGTGKSHTITAIIFDAILKNKSVLVLSDKKEALDVVEDKITQTMNKVRYDKNFQNPILRLGKTGSTYGQILAKSAVEGIKTHFRAVKKDYENLEQNIEKSANSLREDIEAEILAYGDIDIKEIQEFYDLELVYEKDGVATDMQEALGQPQSVMELEDFRKIFTSFKKAVSNQEGNNNELLKLINFSAVAISNLKNFEDFLNSLKVLNENIQRIGSTYSADKLHSLTLIGSIKDEDAEVLAKFIKEYEALKHWLFGHFFNKEKVEKLDAAFRTQFPYSDLNLPHQHVSHIKNAAEIYAFIKALREQSVINLHKKINYSLIVYKLLNNEGLVATLRDLIGLSEDVEYLKELAGKYPKTLKKIGASVSDFKTLCENQFTQLTDFDFNRLVRYVNLKQKLDKDFNAIPKLSYAARKQDIEDLATAQATYILDGRLINFYESSKNDAETLRNIIKNKQRFPRNEFMKLKEAFPCILAGVRDYAEYIPLEPEIFDLVIIDEASQVSIAQAFPALLRAKKVLILGDKKQFSNIKAAQARSDTNREYLNNLESSFKENISSDVSKLVKLSKFNIKTSILEFFEFISNYNIQLLKHFRGYKEIISYSNKYFYQESLQVMKIRGKSIDDVIKFSLIKSDGKAELTPNTNAKEAEFIIAELQKLKEEDKNSSVGIITPHTNQQKLLVEMINKLPERDYFLDKLQLKIMTFDTCQGEERDIIFYSMVATKDLDRLWGVFIKDLSNVDIEEDGQIKAQRLNVGLSRAKECVNFVISKPLDEYVGSIGEALRHYQYVLAEARKEKNVSEVDEKSKMEPEVMNWFYQTSFWKENKENIEFIPQFEIGKYLKQLDRTYTHPHYKVDFLLVYKDASHREHKIIIEYDGFKEHFKNIDEVNEFNYEYYYSDDDVYREKVLESYGYKFLRINKFNIGKNPIATLDNRIGGLLKNTEDNNGLLSNIQETVEGLQNGQMKECPKCKEVRELDDFKDTSLITGSGRFCKYCKASGSQRTYTPATRAPVVLSDKTCPRCSARMILRNGRRGKFYGCSKFPYCRGTRPV